MGWPAGDVADEDAVAAIVRLSGGDARRALTILDAAAAGAEGRDGTASTSMMVARAVDQAAVRYDRDGDQHYDVTSAFIKSIRGSDVDAALHYLARMIEAGEDPRFIARRLVIHASEDIGMADPSALQTAVAALTRPQFVGLPEARIPLGAGRDPPGDGSEVERCDRGHRRGTRRHQSWSNRRCATARCVTLTTRGPRIWGWSGYRYPHDDPRGVVPQQYAPDAVVGRRYYRPTEHGFEQTVTANGSNRSARSSTSRTRQTPRSNGARQVPSIG